MLTRSKYFTQNSYSQLFSQRKKTCIFQIALLYQRKNSCSVSLGILLHKHYSASFEGRKTCHLLKTLLRCASILPRCWIKTLPASSGSHKQACACARHGCIHNSETELFAITWDSIHRVLKPAPWNLFPIIPSNRHIIWNTPFLNSFVTLPLNLNRFSINCLIKNDNFI